ncbi:MAG: SIR2 family protein [Candidatus Omnitrophica bacterium]|nr:SIR2 family protein [Candidatus Omnitrophota bacterium]MDD5042324.1 SIR2 family protein [Candidatus Omnitrophota bacterium]MDD5500451.1 SIR2 family protein [Candidatus Omnitrophota bacterium]
MSRDIVFFLGAGFSYSAGMPTMAQFGEESERDFSGIAKIYNVEKLSLEILLDAGTYFRYFQEYCGNNFVRIDKNNMEDIYCVAEVMAASGVQTISLNNKTISLEDLLTQIKLWLWKVFQQLPPVNSERKDRVNEQPYQDFINFLKTNEIVSRCAAITTNYDLILEYYAWRGGILSSYPFLDSEASTAYIGEKTVSEYVHAGEIDDSLMIYKLHGSVNYFAKKNDPVLKILNGVTPAGGRVGNSIWPTDAPSIFFLDAIYEIKRLYPDYVPAIVAPTYAKIEASSWLKKVWHEAIECLRNAKAIVFIGYGLPQTDGFVKAMFQTAFLGKGTASPNIYVLSRDSTGKVQKRYSELFPNNLYFYKGLFAEKWADLSKQILRDIQ